MRLEISLKFRHYKECKISKTLKKKEQMIFFKSFWEDTKKNNKMLLKFPKYSSRSFNNS